MSLGNRFTARRDGARLAVDYAANATSLGCRGVAVADADGLAAALSDARAGAVTSVINCPTAPNRPLVGSGAFWDLGVPGAGADAIAAEHEAARSRLQRHH